METIGLVCKHVKLRVKLNSDLLHTVAIPIKLLSIVFLTIFPDVLMKTE